MKLFSILALALTLGFTMPVSDAEAAQRLGGGKSAGMQRQMGTPDKSPNATAVPAQAASAKAPVAGAAAAAPRSSWMGPLAGLAAGIGLAALASHFGFGEELASMLMIGLVVMAVMVVIGMIMRRRAGGQQPAMAGMGASAGGGMFKNGTADSPDAAPLMRTHEVAMPGSAASPSSLAPAANIPADFDAPAFERNAKINFIRLQAANDAGNIDDIREFTTPEMFAELKMTISERGAAAQHTDVISINAQVLDVAEEASRYVVSVRFTGVVSEGPERPSESIDEIWHLVKPREGRGGWLLAGIQIGNN